MGINLGMYVEQGNGNQPQDCPGSKEVVGGECRVSHDSRKHSFLHARYHREPITARSHVFRRNATGPLLDCERSCDRFEEDFRPAPFARVEALIGLRRFVQG
jgi:hypothetical protein